MRRTPTLRGAILAMTFCTLCFGAGCGVGVGVFVTVDQLFDVWPNEPPLGWVPALLVLTYGTGALAAATGAWWLLHRARDGAGQP